MMITAELASIYRLAIERQLALRDDSPQPVVASTTLNSRRPVFVPERDMRVAQNDEATDKALIETVAPRHDRRREDQHGDPGDGRNDRRKQALPTPIDTRSTRARRRSDPSP